jgi:glycine/serine hydroxymethyltransferase
MIWINLTNKNLEGWHAHVTLEAVNIFGNKQTIPNDPRPPYYPSGFRIGTPAVTTRKMKEKEMRSIAGFINEGVEIARRHGIENEMIDKSSGIKDRKMDNGGRAEELTQEERKKYKKWLGESAEIKKLREKVIAFARKFPVP